MQPISSSFNSGLSGIRAATKRLDEAAENVAAMGALAGAPAQQQPPVATTPTNGTTNGPVEVDLASQMVSARQAVLEVRANVRTIDAVREMYEAVLELGRPA